MTDSEKDVAWRSLSENIRKEIRKGYNELKYYWHITVDRRNGAMASYENIFGKHNLTATEKEKPRFSKGDRMRYIGEYQEFANKIWIIDGEVFYNDYHKCDMVSSLINGSAHLCNVPLSDLEPYTEEQEPSIETEEIRKAEEELQERKAEHLDRMLYHEKYCTYEVTLDEVNPDWLAYRMELVKDTLRYITSCSTPQEMKANELADYVMTTVDGIVERLKGDEK